MNNKIIHLIKDLVLIESTEEKPDNLKKIIDYVENYYSDTSLYIERFEHNLKHSIIVSNNTNKEKTIILNGHLDVVSGEPSQFKLKQSDDIIIGRGVFDMKSFAAIMMFALKEITKTRPDLSIGMILTTDEEIGGNDGMKYLIDDLGYSCKIAYVPDGCVDFNIQTDAKGMLRIKITATGKTSHAAYLWDGDNAIEKLINVYMDLKKHYRQPKSANDWITSVNLSILKGGDTINKVPDRASMYLDIRFPAPATSTDIINEIKNITNRDDITVEVTSSGSTLHTDITNKYLNSYSKLAKEYTNRTIEFCRSAAASDARFISSNGTPVIMTRGRGGGAHSKNEWASLSDIEKQYQILLEFLQSIN